MKYTAIIHLQIVCVIAFQYFLLHITDIIMRKKYIARFFFHIKISYFI